MNDDRKRRQDLTVSPGSGSITAWLRDVVRQGRLAWRLFWDERVPFWTKTIPPVVLAYILSPVDIVTDLAPGVGQLDDVAILLIGIKLFIELAPQDVVREHLQALGAQIKEWRVVDEEEAEEGEDVVEAEYQISGPEEQLEEREEE